MTLAPLLDVQQTVEGIYFGRLRALCAFLSERTAADAIDRPRRTGLSLVVDDLELHTVGVIGQDNVGVPYKLRAFFSQHGVDGPVGEVPFARCCQTAVKRDAESLGAGVARKIRFGRQARTHGMTAGWALPYAV